MTTKQDTSYTFNDAGFKSVDDIPQQRREILSSSAVVEGLWSTQGGNQIASPMHATTRKRNTMSIAHEETTTKKIRSDSFVALLKEDDYVDAYHGEFDLCTPEGQIAALKAESSDTKTQLTWDQAKHAARREYNRVNAARARQRHKEEAEMRDQEIAQLKTQVEQLTRLNEVLINSWTSRSLSCSEIKRWKRSLNSAKSNL